jgi:hypothetical protein
MILWINIILFFIVIFFLIRRANLALAGAFFLIGSLLFFNIVLLFGYRSESRKWVDDKGKYLLPTKEYNNQVSSYQHYRRNTWTYVYVCKRVLLEPLK